MSYTEMLHWQMIYWNRYDDQRHLHAMGRVSSIRLIRIESQQDEDRV